MKTSRFRFILLVSLFIFLSGCAPFLVKPAPLSFDKPGQCREFLNRLDEVVRKEGVRDASSVSIPRFPYLRTNRFLAELKRDLKEEEQRGEWVRWMQQLGFRVQGERDP